MQFPELNRQISIETFHTNAIGLRDHVAGTAGMKLVERPEAQHR